MQLSRIEQETMINYNNGEKTATLCTADPVIIRKMDKKVEQYPDDYKLIKNTDPYKTYEFSKKLIQFRAPVKYTEEQKKELANRLKNYRS